MSSAWQQYRNERARIDRLVASGALRRADARNPRAIEIARDRIEDGQAGWRDECRRLGIPAPSKVSARRAFEWWMANHPAAGRGRPGEAEAQLDLFGELRERGRRRRRRRSKGRGGA
jgi:hypothetical protein